MGKLKWMALILIAAISLPWYALFAQENEWSTKKSKHFIIYYQQTPTEYISKVIGSAEHYYKSITDYLGFRRFNFWTFDRRCKIYLYPNQEKYLEDTQPAPWSKGGVHVIRKEIFTYVREDEFFDYVLPHEMGHIIFREIVGFDKKLPLWIDEGVALLQEKDRERYLAKACRLAREKSYIPLNRLSRIRGYQKVEPLVFYSESASLMEFLLEEFGRERFITFCRRLRDGGEWRESLLGTYNFENLNELEEAWIDNLVTESQRAREPEQKL
jgi:hypothetical protein